DMLHGNLLLHGWTIADVMYSTTEVPQYQLDEHVLGNFGRVVRHVRDGPAVQQQVAVQHVPGLQGLVRAVRGSGIGPREPEETEEQGDGGYRERGEPCPTRRAVTLWYFPRALLVHGH